MRPRVLIVEDDAATREILFRIIAGQGCDCDLAADGEKAIGFLATYTYDLAVIDIVLPKLSGTDLLEYILSTTPELIERSIVVTGLDAREVRKLFPTILDVLGKPVLPTRLADLVRRSLAPRSPGVSVA